MTVEALLTQLATGGDGHQRALWGLVERGAEAVPALISALLDENSPIGWSDAGFILRKIGKPAFTPLVDALAWAPTNETRRRCGWAFVGFGEGLLDDYARALSHPSRHVRRDAALALGYLKGNGVAAIPALLPLLADPDEEVRTQVAWSFGELGDAAIPALQAVRAAGPGRLRSGALRALAEAAGERGLLERDRAAIERLIRIKLLNDRPDPVDDCAVCGPWLALRTGDQRAVLDALDLSDPQPATWRLGYAAFYSDRHGMAPDGQREGRVFVTPEVDGWTLVLGAWYTRWGDADSYGRANRALSEQFGHTQAYWYDAQTGESAWSICDHGEIVRWYDPEETPSNVGDRLPVEQGKFLIGDDIDDHELHDLDLCHALMVAAAMSVSPADLGPPTNIHGHGVLALTAKGRAHGTPEGALPI